MEITIEIIGAYAIAYSIIFLLLLTASFPISLAYDLENNYCHP